MARSGDHSSEVRRVAQIGRVREVDAIGPRCNDYAALRSYR